MNYWTVDQLQEHYRSLGLLTCGHPATDSGICGIPWCDELEKSVPNSEQPDSVEWPESMIEAECTRLLEMDGWRALRTDPVSDRGRGKGFGELGMADHLYLRYKKGADPASRARTINFIKAEMDAGRYAGEHYDEVMEILTSAGEIAGEGLYGCQIMWIEFKSAKGKPAKHQTEWHTKERSRGALTWIAGVDFPASVAGFVEHYRKSGLNRGRV